MRRRFESSDLSGQRARRILLRAEEWREGRSGEVLGELDLARVEEGKDGMRARTHDEERLVEASRLQVERRRRQRRRRQLAAVVAVALILGAALLFLWQRQQARAAEERARDRAYVALGFNLEADQPSVASLVALEIRLPDSTPTADSLLHKALADSMPIATLTGHKSPVIAASFSPDGTQVMTTSLDNNTAVRIWDAATGQPIVTALPVFFNPDGTWVVPTYDLTPLIWNAGTGQSVATLTEHTDTVLAASFSPDGTRVVVTTSGDQTARIWNAATVQPIATLTGHTDAVRAASFSPDGTRLVTASEDKTARIWPVASEYMQGLIRARTASLPSRSISPQTLGEDQREAEHQEKACQACVPKFFARVKGVPRGDAQAYITAWRAYRGCLNDER